MGAPQATPSSQTSERSERDPGPITTGLSYVKGLLLLCFIERFRGMGPGFRGDDGLRLE